MRGGQLSIRLVLLGSLCACGGDAEADGAGGGPPPARVELGTARSGTLTVQRTYLGQVRSLARAELSAGASGAVREVRVREGDRVEKGDVLVLMDERLARAELAAARAASEATETQREQAQRDAERYERAGRRTVAGIEIERAAARASTLSAEEQTRSAMAARARAELSRHRVQAPFAGVISRRMIDPGDWVSEGTVVLELVADDAVEVTVRAEPALLDDVDVGHAATLLRGDRTVPATVQAIVPALDPATRTVQVRLIPEERPRWLLAGDTVDVRMELERDGPGVVVPRDALVAGAVETRVVRVEDGAAVPVTVEVLDRGTDEVRVEGEGLEEGTALVVRGNERLRPGQPLEVVE